MTNFSRTASAVVLYAYESIACCSAVTSMPYSWLCHQALRTNRPAATYRAGRFGGECRSRRTWGVPYSKVSCASQRRTGPDVAPQASLQTSNKLIATCSDGQILVTLLDGQLVSLDHDTGVIRWTLNLGRPLVSASGVWHEQTSSAHTPLSHTILPGADGSLYIFTDTAGVAPAFEV